MSVFRQSRHPLVRWWWEVDRPTIALLFIIMIIGAIAVTTASVATAKTYSVPAYFFALKQYVFLGGALAAMLGLTVLRPAGVERVGWLLFFVALAGIVLTLFTGQEVKGASRWLTVMGQSIQPSEFMKPALIVVTAALLSDVNPVLRQRGFWISCVLMGLIGVLLLQQPDVGMLLLFGSVWAGQVFLSGISILWLGVLGLAGLGAIVGAYTMFEHVQSRVARFLNPEGADTYQVDQAREAVLTGHLFGRGAGEGVVKHNLPDAHTDFIFAVIAEEFGILLCLALLMLYVLVILRGFAFMFHQQDRFIFLAVGGLMILLALQVMVNIGVALHLLPTTGMTLPFVSYGGSATLAMGIAMGFLLAVSRKRRLRL
jgi:cell division protein FtsW